MRESASIWFWALGVPGAAAVAAWPLGAWGLLLLAAYPAQGFRIFRRRRRCGDPARVALGYAALCLLGKWPRWLGQVRYALDRWRGREARLIEYRPGRAG